MKILAIRGKNIASLEGEFEVDFTQEPLLSAPLFAITGPTGSGKTTLLDTLCLALYEETPRMGKANDRAKIRDVNGGELTLNDVRSNLRRGCADGYAEADFEALNGKRYRATWLVRRARNKTTGALQSADHKLLNLDTNSEVQGTKKDILEEIEKLLGLTFAQFTRTVLLAQGDFANFLKANQNEKAELLEKLTGTEIYSTISKKIHENSKNEAAKCALLNAEKDKIAQNLLENEQKTALFNHLTALKGEIEAFREQETQCSKKLEWFKSEMQYNNQLKNAENELKSAENELKSADFRLKTLQKIEQSLEIRDCCIQTTELHRKNLAEKQQIAQKVQLLGKKVQLLEKSEQEIARFEREEMQFNAENKQINSQIEQAKLLDERLKQAKNNHFNLKNDIFALKNDKKQHLNRQETLLEKFKNDEKRHLELEKWLTQHACFSQVIDSKSLIISMIDTTAAMMEAVEKQRKRFEENSAMLSKSEAQLAELKRTAEELAQMLTTEVLTLRARLKPNEPCPVCGSLQHPISEKSATFESKMDENEWKSAQNENQQAMETLQTQISELRVKNLSEKQGSAQLSAQIDANLSQLATFLSSPLPQWKALFERRELSLLIDGVTKNWGAYQEEIKELKVQLAAASADLKNIAENLQRLDNQLVTKEKEEKEGAETVAKLQQERQQLFGGKSIEAVEQEQAARLQQLQKNLASARQTDSQLKSEKAMLSGELEQIRRKSAEFEAELAQKRAEIAQWLSQHPEVTREELREFGDKSMEWIAQERDALQALKDAAVSAQATYGERLKQYEAHLRSENRPSETESAENQEVTKAQLTKKIKEHQDEIIKISHQLTRDEEERVKFEAQVKACEKQQEISSKWLKLNELFGSASGDKFKVIAQKYTLEALLQYANIHLQSLTKRYRLQTISDTMALQIEDRDMLNEVRSVHTLSGGESFLLSLALALGLASLSTQVAQQMQIGSLFIDEGFGALDSESLQLVFDALGCLQMQGRKIGIISHINDMTEHIPVQIQLKKFGNGRSNIHIINKLQK